MFITQYYKSMFMSNIYALYGVWRLVLRDIRTIKLGIKEVPSPLENK